MMDDYLSIKYNYEPTLKEYQDFQWWSFVYENVLYKIVFFLMITGGMFKSYMYFVDGRDWWYFLFTITALFYPYFAKRRVFRKAEKTFRKMGVQDIKLDMEVNYEGIKSLKKGILLQERPWTDVTDIYENRGYFIVFYNNNRYSLFNKKKLGNDDTKKLRKYFNSYCINNKLKYRMVY